MELSQLYVVMFGDRKVVAFEKEEGDDVVKVGRKEFYSGSHGGVRRDVVLENERKTEGVR